MGDSTALLKERAGFSSRLGAWGIALSLLTLVLAGCPDNSSGTGSSGTATSAASTSTSPFIPGASGSIGSDTPTTNGTAAFITLSQAVLSNVNPTSLVDLIGTNSDIGNNCPDVSSCQCVFSWTDSNGVLRNSQVGLTYVETNLARCSYSVVTNATYFDVTLLITAANLSSNSMRLYISSAQPALDPSLASNYLPVVRYMCRDVLGTNASGASGSVNTTKYGTSLVDPALWDYSYPYTLYTTSIGRDYGAVQTITANGLGPSVKGWECPPIPNDISNNPIYDYHIYSLAPIDVTDITNPAPNPNSKTLTNMIWPPNSTNANNPNCPTGAEPGCEQYLINRHDFYLATFSSAVFTQPVCIIHRVSNLAGGSIDCTQIDTSSGSITIFDPTIATQDEIGFAAFPDVNENCPAPSVVTIPAGKKWAKLWQFRTSYDIRYVDDNSNQSDIGSLFCTNREDECASNSPGINSTTSPGDLLAPNIVNLATGGSGTTVTNQAVDTVCWNTRNPSGYAAGLAIGATTSKQVAPGAQMFGNCNSTLNWGDGNGDEPDGTYSVFGGAFPYQATETNSSYNGINNAPQSCTGGPSGAFNCCTDAGHGPNNLQLQSTQTMPSGPSSQYASLPANYAIGGGNWCTPTLIGSHDASAGSGLVPALPPGPGSPPVFSKGPTGAIGLAEDIWLVGNGNKSACIEADTTSTGSLYNPSGVYPPPTRNPFINQPKQIDSSSPSDILYVVTPANITMSQMQNPSVNPPNVAAQFTPWRPKPVQGGNDPNGAQQIYSLTTNSATGASGVNSNVASARLSQYPICVLQDAVAGAAPGNVAP